jgi:TolA-binding protein
MSETIKVAVKLEDGVSGPAKTASQALADLRQGLDRSSAELGQMKKAMREMKAAGDTSSASFKTLEEQIKTKTGAIGSMRAKYIELGGDFRKVKPPVKELRATAQAAQDAVAPTSALGGMMAKLGGTLAAGAAAAVAAVGAALVALAAATVAAGAALLSYGISQADARRSEGLRLEGLTRLRRGYQAAGGSASEMQASIDRVSDSSSASRSTLEGYAERLHRLGLRGFPHQPAASADDRSPQQRQQIGVLGAEYRLQRLPSFPVTACLSIGDACACHQCKGIRRSQVLATQIPGHLQQFDRMHVVRSNAVAQRRLGVVVCQR